MFSSKRNNHCPEGPSKKFHRNSAANLLCHRILVNKIKSSSAARIQFLSYFHSILGIFLLVVCLQSQMGNASPPGIIFDDVMASGDAAAVGEEDYGISLLTNEQREQTHQAGNQAKPDDVDNEVIQSLVDNFLNKGTVAEGASKQEIAAGSSNLPQKVNKDALALVNSSDYWRTQNLDPPNSISDPARTQSWLSGYSIQLQRVLQQMALAGWNYFTAASYTTKQYLDEAEEVGRAFLRATAQQAAQFNATAFAYGTAERVQLSVLAQQGMNALDQAELTEFNRLLLSINQQFAHTQLCGEPGKAPMDGDKTACLLKFSDIPTLLNGPSADAQQCLELWQKWRLAAGPNLTASYAELVELSNKGARLNGFPDAGAQWRAVYELPGQFGFFPERQLDIGQQLDILYTQMAPLYEQLMAYFRPRLASIHSKKGNEENQKAGQVSRDGPLPLHLLKSLNGDSWSAYYELTKPFGEEMPAEGQKIANELVDAFHAQNYTVRVMFAKVYRFMKYVGFERLPKSFWTNSIFTRNWAKDMICHPATAYDMMDGNDDYRIKVCGQLTEQDFVNAHRLLAKLFYQYGSRKQPILLRDAPNPSLSSALAGAFSILALNPEYLRAQKLIDPQTERNGPAEINRLYKEALEEIVKLPFAIVADKWRYAVFEGKVNSSNWSQEWWALRQKYQGIRAPSMALPKAIEYDAVSSPAITQFHAPATRDAIAYIAQFQVLKKLCSGIDKISQGCLPTKNEFQSVHEAISQGGSIPWINAFEKLTGSRQLDAGPMLEYFEPLMEWLKNTNKNEQRILGWPNPKGDPFTEAELPELHNEYQNENQNQQWAGGDSGLGLGSADGSGERIAFPGQKCEKGQECLLDSQCNGTICVCREGLYTLKIADSYNCVPGDPAKLGFTNENGGLLIDLSDRDKAAGGGGNGTTESESTNDVGNDEKEGNDSKMSSSNGKNMPSGTNDGGGKKATANGTNGMNISPPFGWIFLAFLLLNSIPMHFIHY